MKKLVKGFASVILASMFVFIGCNQTTGGSKSPSGGSDPKITVTVQGDEHVEKVEPATLSVRKGSTWSAIKSKINVTYKNGYGEAGWKLDNADGDDLTDDKKFEKDTTIFACSGKLLTITVKGDEHVDKIITTTLSVAKGSKWSAVKPRINVTYKNGYGEAGWKLDNADGDDLTDDKAFEKDTTVYAVSKEVITITVQGDDGIEIPAENTFTVDKNTKWKDIKIAATAKISVKENYALFEWRLNDEIGDVITTDDLIFTGSATVFAVSKEAVTVTVAHDAGVEKVEPATLSVAKGITWSAIKSQIRVTPKPDFVHAGWKLDNASGTDLTDDYSFEKDTTVYALSKETITITVKGDAGIEIPAENTFTVDKNAKWGDIKTAATDKITVKENYEFVEWRVNDKAGKVLTDDKTFEQNATVFAVSKKQLVTITVQGDAGIDIAAENTFTVDKNAKWGEIKDAAEAKITVKENYDLFEWHLNSGTGEVLTDDKKFEQNAIVFAVSKKQQVTITVKGDAGIDIAAENTFTVDKNTKWIDIKNTATDKITVKENYEFVEWRVNNKAGKVLTDDKTFEQNATVFAVSKKQLVTITVKGDAGIDIAAENTFTADKNAKWGDIKTTAKAKISVKENYEFVEWRLNDKTGKVLTDDKAFEQNATVFAVSKEVVTITVKGDAGVDIAAENTFTVDKNAKWGDIKDLAKAKISVKENYELVEWRLNDKTGAILSDDKAFEKNATVFAVSKETVTITVEGDAGVDIVTENTFTVDKNAKWGDIKDAAKAKISVKANYRFVEWRVNDKTGDLLEENTAFTKNATVYACSEKVVTLTVKGDERIDLSSPLQIEYPYNTKWSDIQADIKEKIKPSADWKDDWNNGDYAVYEWRLGDKDGKNINDDYRFTDNTTVYAVSNYVKLNIYDSSYGDYKVLGGYTGSKPRGKIIIPDGVPRISGRAFYECNNLAIIEIPTSVTFIGEQAFYGCSGLTSIILPKDVKVIEKETFFDCNSLTSIILPKNLTKIKENAFYKCRSLKSITIPARVTSIEWDAFYDCSGLTSASFEDPEDWKTASLGSPVYVGTSEAAIEALRIRTGIYKKK